MAIVTTISMNEESRFVDAFASVHDNRGEAHAQSSKSPILVQLRSGHIGLRKHMHRSNAPIRHTVHMSSMSYSTARVTEERDRRSYEYTKGRRSR